MKIGLVLLILFLVLDPRPGWETPGDNPPTESQDETRKIEQILAVQRDAWNNRDLRQFMSTYWKSPELTFSGGGSTTRGWQATLDRYLQNYPAESMGELQFSGLETTLLGDSAAMVLGRWRLDLDGEIKQGNFSLVLRRLPDGWKIIHDHSSTLDPEKGWLSIDQALTVLRGHHRLAADTRLEVHSEGPILSASTPESGGESNLWIDRRTGEVLETAPKSGKKR